MLDLVSKVMTSSMMAGPRATVLLPSIYGRKADMRKTLVSQQKRGSERDVGGDR